MIETESFIEGVTTEYDNRLLEDRLSVEAQLTSVLLQDLSLYDDASFQSENFLTKDGRLLFNIGKKLRDDGYNLVDEVTVKSQCDTEVKNRLEELGGYDEVIGRQINVVSLQNVDTIIENFKKSNVILGLYKQGFNLFKTIQLKNRKSTPIELFKNLKSSEILTWYEAQLNTLGIVSSTKKIVNEEYLSFNQSFFDELKQGTAQGVPYSNCGYDIEKNLINTFPYLSRQTQGFGVGLHALVGHSGTGKTTMAIEILLSMVANGSRFVIVENEMSLMDIKIIFLTFIINRFFNYDNLTRTKIKSGQWDDKDREILEAAVEFWNRKYEKSIKIVVLADMDIDSTCQIIKNAILREGYNAFLVDTFKLDTTTNSKDNNFWISLIADSKRLHSIALQNDVVGLITIQLAINTIGKLWLDKSCLSTSKGVCEILDTCIGMRNVYKEELVVGSDIFCHPFRKKVDPNTNERYEEEYFPDATKFWRMWFIIKSRSCETSDDSGEALLIRFDAQHCSMYETSYARPSTKTMNMGRA